MFIAGYPPEDLVLKPAFQEACEARVENLPRHRRRRPRASSSARRG
jgi:NAD+ synthase